MFEDKARGMAPAAQRDAAWSEKDFERAGARQFSKLLTL
jgi:hypothetical protein